MAETIYFGGGTPSLLPLPLLAEILAACRDTFPVPRDAEISLEANPGTVDAAYLDGLRALGVNRLSLGVQSAHQAELDFLKRGHSFQDAIEAVHLARAAGFDNLNVDLIYGIPRQTMAMWQETVDRTLRACARSRFDVLSHRRRSHDVGVVGAAWQVAAARR